MGHKTHPISLRLGLHEPWRARWFAKSRAIAPLLEEDEAIRSVIRSRFKDVGIADIEIERGTGPTTVRIKAARPGLIIGRRGNGIDLLRSSLEKAMIAVRKQYQRTEQVLRPGMTVRIEVEEVRKPDTVAAIVAEGIARDLTRRTSPRRTLKQALARVTQHPEVRGVKLMISGRLGGSEISRSEWLKRGELPLSTLRAAIDHAQRTAFTSYGTIGVKVWIYKGEKFE